MLPNPLFVLPLNLALLMGRVSNHLSPSRHAAAFCLQVSPFAFFWYLAPLCDSFVLIEILSISAVIVCSPLFRRYFIFSKLPLPLLLLITSLHPGITSVDFFRSGTKALVPVPLDGILVPLG